ncbi:serine protease 56 [Ahaetulla prasina]|uniref:serine protease 56 n=1 Tax=Ahaetulla prasina TaxID=499056 RepID=UPI00264937EF|nr:serine protease 56 [Ahaetulla prasina]
MGPIQRRAEPGSRPEPLMKRSRGCPSGRWVYTAPSCKELFPLPASVLRALSNRGTLVLEAAMKAALLSLEKALSEHGRRLQECERCGFCLSGDCGNRSRPCTQPGNDAEDSNSVADQPVPESCGHRAVPAPNMTLAKGKIVGGSRAKPGAWPWLVSVLLNGELMCSGVLVDTAWIVTAAHCFTGSRNELAWSVVLGDYDLSKRDESEQVVPVSRILPHPKFDPKTFHADVALLELSAPVRPSAWVSPVCLPERAAEMSQEVLCYIVGWGSLYEDGPPAEVVMEARVPILAQDLCRGALGSQLVSSAMFCAGYLSGGIDSCQVRVREGAEPEVKGCDGHSLPGGVLCLVLPPLLSRAPPVYTWACYQTPSLIMKMNGLSCLQPPALAPCPERRSGVNRQARETSLLQRVSRKPATCWNYGQQIQLKRIQSGRILTSGDLRGDASRRKGGAGLDKC